MSSNRRVLVDNATLSGVERLTGVSQTINLNYIDNDILCLEKLLTAILFSDELIGVDDYKDNFRSKRLKNFDFVSFSKIDQPAYRDLTSQAADFAQSMTFSLEEAKPAGDVVSFFEALRIHPQLRWNVWVSSEYLTLSYLVNDTRKVAYESSIDSIFRSEDTDRGLVAAETNHQPDIRLDGSTDISNIKDLIHAFRTGNPQFSGEDGKSALGRMIFGYGWAAERSHFYNAVADAEEADTYLAPLRDAFCESCCRIDYPSQTAGLLENLKGASRKTLSSIFEPSGQAHFAIRLPFFTAYLISKTDNPKQCIDLALELRGSSDLRECRAIFYDLDRLPVTDRTKKINGMFQTLERSCDKLMRKYAISTESGSPVSISLGLSGIGLSTDIKLGQLFRSYENRPITRVFRNIAQDMVNTERLGGLYAKVCSSMREHRDANCPRISATPHSMEHKENEHGRPAKL